MNFKLKDNNDPMKTIVKKYTFNPMTIYLNLYTLQEMKNLE